METYNATAANLQLEFSQDLRSSILYVVNTYIETHYEWEKENNVYLEKEFIAERAWEHVLKKAHKYVPGKASFKTWAKTVAINYAKDEAKRLNKLYKRVLSQVLDEEADEDEDRFDIENLADPSDCNQDVCDQIEKRDAYELIKLVVSSLNGPKRQVADLLLEEMSIEEISAKTNMERGYVSVCKNRVFKILRTELLRAGYNYAA